MTFSILARDPDTGAFGGAAATGNLAVGAWVLRAEAGVGAVATQGWCVSSIWGDEALRRLRGGESAADLVPALTEADEGREFRQLAALDHAGKTAVWTGAENPETKGARQGAGWIVSGNWLSGPGVLDAVAAAYLSGKGAFAERLLAALTAGAGAGSDSRGTLSAGLRVVSEDMPPLDLRVDHHETPVAQLRALYARTLEPEYRSWLDHLPTQARPFRR